MSWWFSWIGYPFPPQLYPSTAIAQPPTHTTGDSPLIVGHTIFEHLAHRLPAQFRHLLGNRHPQFGGGFWGVVGHALFDHLAQQG